MAARHEKKEADLPAKVEEIETVERITIPGRNGGTLTPFQPGESGNRNGRPQGSRSLVSLMNKLLDQEVINEVDGEQIRLTRREALMLQKLDLAFNSEFDAIRLAAIKDIEDRVDGKPVSQDQFGEDDEADAVVFYIPNKHSRKKH